MGENIPHPEGLLVLLVKRSNDDHEHRADTAFQKAKEEALCVQLLVVAADDCQDQTDAPNSDDAGCNTLDRETLGQIHSWIGSDNEPEVEDSCRHGVSVALSEVKIIAKSEQRLYPSVSDAQPIFGDDTYRL